jgi:hypothetical protein
LRGDPSSRFLQGADTDPEDVAKIRQALEAGTSYCGRLLNYKKDGTPFWNLLTISPIKDETGKVLKFIGLVLTFFFSSIYNSSFCLITFTFTYYMVEIITKWLLLFFNLKSVMTYYYCTRKKNKNLYTTCVVHFLIQLELTISLLLFTFGLGFNSLRLRHVFILCLVIRHKGGTTLWWGPHKIYIFMNLIPQNYLLDVSQF